MLALVRCRMAVDTKLSTLLPKYWAVTIQNNKHVDTEACPALPPAQRTMYTLYFAYFICCLQSTVKFCNTSDTQQLLRNSTPNQHTAVLNNICQGRSVWDVILQHNDFHSFADWERKPNEDLRPKFRVRHI